MQSKQVLLELDYLKINRHRRHWNLYFVIATSAPSNNQQMGITTLGGIDKDHPIKLRKETHNELHFRPEGDEGTGLIVLQRAMPEDYSIQARMWLMQSRSGTRELGKILGEINHALEGSTIIKDSEKLLGIRSQWLFANKALNKGIGGVSQALSTIKDRNLGFINMDEHFGDTLLKEGHADLHNNLSTGFAEIGWSWQVFDAESD